MDYILFNINFILCLYRLPKKTLMPSTFLLTLGDPLRIVLDNVVKGLPLLNAARETVEVRVFYYFLIISSCKVLLLFLFKT